MCGRRAARDDRDGRSGDPTRRVLISPVALIVAMPRPRPRPSPPLVRRSLVRSRVRLRVLFALLDLGRATAADLAREARAKPAHVRGALFGDAAAFRRSAALKRLQLVRVEETYTGTLFRLTPFGRRIAKEWRREFTRAHLGLPRRPHA